MPKTYDEKIAEAKEKISQYENQLKAIRQQQKSEERKARTKRLIERGAILESLIGNADNLTNDQIKAFLEKTVANDYGRRTLAALTAQTADTAVNRPAGAAQSGGIPQGADAGNGAGVTG
ncbi:hypothetical protein FACS1894191_4190 [Clostridia bacterium]|nr:hypothetical protein FACS1894191_4190 [Clostridia bacterium]